MKRLKKILTNRYFWLIMLVVLSTSIIFFNSLLFRKIQFQWNLENLKTKTDKIVITYNLKFSECKPVSYSLNEQGQQSFWNCIKVEIPRPGSIRACSCWGNPTVKFYSKSKMIDSFTIQHGKAIRWKKFHWGDISLTAMGQKKLKELFSKYDIHNAQELLKRYCLLNINMDSVTKVEIIHGYEKGSPHKNGVRISDFNKAMRMINSSIIPDTNPKKSCPWISFVLYESNGKKTYIGLFIRDNDIMVQIKKKSWLISGKNKNKLQKYLKGLTERIEKAGNKNPVTK